MITHALLFCNGEPPGRSLARRMAREAGIVVAADGGANIARRLGVRPHVIIGDLDSITPSTRRAFAVSTVLHVRRQDNTDLEKALNYLVARKIKNVSILAATGKRLDFTLANLSVIWRYAPSLTMTFVGDGWTAMPVGRKRQIKARVGTTVSLIPFGACSGITLKGLHYPLTNATMRIGEVGVSNVVRRSPFVVSVKKGKMLLLMLGRKRQTRASR